MHKRALTVLIRVLSVGVLAAAGCGGEDTSRQAGGPDWSCMEADGTTTCTAVSAIEKGNHEAYSCSAQEGGSFCPPTTLGGADPWACIAVRLDLTCSRRLETSGDGNSDQNGGDESAPDPGDIAGCDVPAWKDHFVDLARQTFDEHGVPFEMKSSDLKDDLSIEAPPSTGGDGGSCGPIISDLQMKSWLGAVESECMVLSEYITAWCHNTHLFAAKNGFCGYGAGW